jgi:hypothetical protein
VHAAGHDGRSRQKPSGLPAWSDAEAAGALALRQDIRLLPHLFDVCIHEYAALAHQGWVPERGIDHFLCHYSSERFIPVVDELLGRPSSAFHASAGGAIWPGAATRVQPPSSSCCRSFCKSRASA